MAEDIKPGAKPAEAKPADGKPAAAGHAPGHVESASAAPGEKRSAGRPAKLGRASESGDPAVHKALADLNAAQMNAGQHEAGGGKAYEEQKKLHDKAVADAKKALADLGYE